MRKQKIPSRKRYALWKAHDGKCSYCKEPLRYLDVWVEHILPESLINHPAELNRIIIEYGLGSDFEINDYNNFLPTHWRCNLEKGQTIFERGAALHYISLAQSKIIKAKKEEALIVQNLRADRLLSSLSTAIEEGLISKFEIAHIIKQQEAFHEPIEPIIITFGLTIETVFENEDLPEYVPTFYPMLCDWLETNLVEQLKVILSCEFYYPEASSRDGESLSVRLAFIELNQDELMEFTSSWWEILEIAFYSEVYQD